MRRGDGDDDDCDMKRHGRNNLIKHPLDILSQIANQARRACSEIDVDRAASARGGDQKRGNFLSDMEGRDEGEEER